MGPGLIALLAMALAGCAFPQAARRSSDRLKEGWDVESQGLGVLVSGPTATLRAAGELALYSVVPPEPGAEEPRVKWFRFYDGPMRPADQVAILCHLDRATHIATIRRLSDPVAVPARHKPWHYPECIEAPPGEYELAVSYYSRTTVADGLSATTQTSESTTMSTVRWLAEPGAVYVLAAVVGKPAPAPGSGPGYRVRRRTRELWDTHFKLEISHWKAAIVKLPDRAHLDRPIEAHREAWRNHEALH